MNICERSREGFRLLVFTNFGLFVQGEHSCTINQGRIVCLLREKTTRVMSSLSKAGNLCKACELDSLDPRKMLKRKGGFMWILLGIVGVLVLIKIFAYSKSHGSVQEVFMHEVCFQPFYKLYPLIISLLNVNSELFFCVFRVKM